MIPDEGLLPQLEEGLSLFYAGLSALSAAQGEGLDEVPDVTRGERRETCCAGEGGREGGRAGGTD